MITLLSPVLRAPPFIAGNWTSSLCFQDGAGQDQARGRQGRPRSLKLLARDTVNKGSSSLYSRSENQELGRRQSRNYGSDQANPRGLGAGGLQLRMSWEGWGGGVED